jgi:hypothetical protein
VRIQSVFAIALACFVSAGLASFCLPATVLAIPGGRHYEMVSPPYKGGYGVNNIEATPVEGDGEGERLLFGSEGTFAGAPNNALFNLYLAQRSPEGWRTKPLSVPAGLMPAASLTEFSPTLEAELFNGYRGTSTGVAEFQTNEFEILLLGLDRPELGFQAIGGLKRIDGQRLALGGAIGASRDLCHILFYTRNGAEAQDLLSDAVGTESSLYELTSSAPGCGSVSQLRLVGVNNKLGTSNEPEAIDSHCVTFLGAANSTGGSEFNAIAADGAEIFFTSCVAGPGSAQQLFVRLDGSRTLEVSRPPGGCVAGGIAGEVPCSGSSTRAPAVFQGAAEDGSKVFFTTAAPLVGEDKDSSSDLYMATIGCPTAEPGCEPARREVTALTQVSHDPNAGEAAEVQGVSVLAPDGGRVYFVARGVLTVGTNSEGNSPAKGADNLYVYNAEDGTVQFISDLCSGPGLSGPGGSIKQGAVEDPHCPEDLEAGGVGARHARNDIGLWGSWREAQVADASGRFLIFTSYGQLVSNDTDRSKDVYRYDAQTGSLKRISIGDSGYDANGNNDSFNAELPELLQDGQLSKDDEMNYRAISEDGSRIVFETADPLSSSAVNGLVNAYEWHEEPGSSEGSVSLLSSGSDEEPVGENNREVVISPSGRDVFFMTVQGLLPQDTDGAMDVYDARLGEGLPPVAAQPQACSGDACQGALANPVPLLVPGSVSQAPGENLTPPKKLNAKKKATKEKKHKRKQTRGVRRSRTKTTRGSRR